MPEVEANGFYLCGLIDIFFLFIYLFGWLYRVLVAACRLLSCELLVAACKWDLVPGPRIEPGPLHWERRVLTAVPPEKSLSVA